MKFTCCISLDYVIEIPAACRRQIALGTIDFVYKTSACRKVGIMFHGRVRNGCFRGFWSRRAGTDSTPIMPNIWKKRYTYVKNTLQKKEKKYDIYTWGVSTAEYEILPCKSGGNPGDIAIS